MQKTGSALDMSCVALKRTGGAPEDWRCTVQDMSCIAVGWRGIREEWRCMAEEWRCGYEVVGGGGDPL